MEPKVEKKSKEPLKKNKKSLGILAFISFIGAPRTKLVNIHAYIYYEEVFISRNKLFKYIKDSLEVYN